MFLAELPCTWHDTNKRANNQQPTTSSQLYFPNQRPNIADFIFQPVACTNIRYWTQWRFQKLIRPSDTAASSWMCFYSSISLRAQLAIMRSWWKNAIATFASASTETSTMRSNVRGTLITLPQRANKLTPCILPCFGSASVDSSTPLPAATGQKFRRALESAMSTRLSSCSSTRRSVLKGQLRWMMWIWLPSSTKSTPHIFTAMNETNLFRSRLLIWFRVRRPSIRQRRSQHQLHRLHRRLPIAMMSEMTLFSDWCYWSLWMLSSFLDSETRKRDHFKISSSSYFHLRGFLLLTSILFYHTIDFWLTINY